MTKRLRISLILTIFLPFFIAIWPQPSMAIDGKTIAQRVYNRDDGETSHSLTQMRLTDKRGKTRQRTLLSIAKDFGPLRKVYTRFSSPADIKGTVFLVWENQDRDDDQFLYLPALKRLRRIVSRQKKSRFVNSDFTYEDMQRKKPDESHHRLVQSVHFANRDCWVLESIPKKGTSQYKKWVTWVDKEYLLPHKVEYYSKKGKLFKRLLSKNIKKIDDIWTALDVEMHDLKKRHTTRMRIKKIHYNRKVNNIVFSQSFAKKGR